MPNRLVRATFVHGMSRPEYSCIETKTSRSMILWTDLILKYVVICFSFLQCTIMNLSAALLSQNDLKVAPKMSWYVVWHSLKLHWNLAWTIDFLIVCNSTFRQNIRPKYTPLHLLCRKFNCPSWFPLTSQSRDLILERFVNFKLAGLYIDSNTTRYHSSEYHFSFQKALEILSSVGSALVPNQ